MGVNKGTRCDVESGDLLGGADHLLASTMLQTAPEHLESCGRTNVIVLHFCLFCSYERVRLMVNISLAPANAQRLFYCNVTTSQQLIGSGDREGVTRSGTGKSTSRSEVQTLDDLAAEGLPGIAYLGCLVACSLHQTDLADN